ncbi:MAG: hypothetical protein M1840_001900 [Geoglossum simile]|nr:MAG: hypothetical protein M1840_001900 [Geoglossum simile]
MSTDFMKCLRLLGVRAAEFGVVDWGEGEVGGSEGKKRRRLDVVALGGLGGRVDQGLSQLHHLYMAGADVSLGIERVVLLTGESVTFLLEKGLNRIYTPAGRGLAENVGILPIGRPAVISTRGLEWDVHDWRTEFGGQISTSNHVKSDVVEVRTSEQVVFTIELELRSGGWLAGGAQGACS